MNAIEKTLIGTGLAVGLWAQTPPPQPPAAPEPPRAMALQMMMQGASGSFLGVGVAEIDNDRAKALNLSEVRGVEVTQVEPDSPAAKAGLQKGDVVLEYNGQRVEGTEQFVRLVRETPVGRSVKMSVNRNGSMLTVTATTASRKSKMRAGDQFHFTMPEIRIPDIPRVYTGWRSSMIGIEAESLDTQLADYFGVKEGVLVRSVVKGSAAEKAGLKAGDVITKVEGEKTASPKDVSAAIRSKKGQRSIPVTLVRERREMTVNINVEDEGTPNPALAPRPARPARPVRN